MRERRTPLRHSLSRSPARGRKSGVVLRRSPPGPAVFLPGVPMGFTKLDEGIIFSSIMAEDDAVFRVWIILLATCRQNGVSPVTIPFLCRITGKPAEEIGRCLAVLAGPDPLSRSDTYDGARIRRVDGEYEILNYAKYRAETKTDYFREKQRLYRDRIATVDRPSASASASASASDQGGVGGREGSGEPGGAPPIGTPATATTPALTPAPAASPPIGDAGSGAECKAKSRLARARPAETIPPTREELVAYCETRARAGHRRVDPAAWYNHYESNGWRVGRNKMASWTAAVRTWENSDIGQGRRPDASTGSTDSGRYKLLIPPPREPT